MTRRRGARSMTALYCGAQRSRTRAGGVTWCGQSGTGVWFAGDRTEAELSLWILGAGDGGGAEAAEAAEGLEKPRPLLQQPAT